MKKNYFPILDILRFFAAISVLMLHYFSVAVSQNTDWISRYITHGYLGVELFFIISGFVIFFSLQKPIKEYALGRFIRLYPLFWILCTITYIITLIWTPDTALSLKHFFMNLLIINDNKVAFLVDGVYWTLTQELIFYTMIGFFVYFFSLKRIEWFFGIWLLTVFLTFYFGFENSFITKIALTRYATFFSIGGLTALIYSQKDAIQKSIHMTYIRYGLLFSSLLLIPYVSEKLKVSTAYATNKFGVFNHDSYIFLSILILLFFSGILINNKINNKKLIKISLMLGAMTYPLYLIHSKIGSIVIGFFESFGQISVVSISVAICMVLASYVISRGDSHMRKFLHIRMKKWLRV